VLASAKKRIPAYWEKPSQARNSIPKNKKRALIPRLPIEVAVGGKNEWIQDLIWSDKEREGRG